MIKYNINIIKYNIVKKMMNYIDYFDGLTLVRCVCVRARARARACVCVVRSKQESEVGV